MCENTTLDILCMYDEGKKKGGGRGGERGRSMWDGIYRFSFLLTKINNII